MRAVSRAHALPTAAAAAESGAHDTAMVHRVIKRYLNTVFIELHFGPDATVKKQDEIICEWEQTFGAALTKQMKDALFLALNASGRTFHPRKIKKRTRPPRGKRRRKRPGKKDEPMYVQQEKPETELVPILLPNGEPVYMAIGSQRHWQLTVPKIYQV